MPASSLSYNNINSDSRMIPDIMRVFGVCGNQISMAKTIEKSSCIKNWRCRHLRANSRNRCFARNHVLALGGESRQKMGEVLDFCLPDLPKSGHAVPKVDKKWERYLIFVYLTLQIQARGSKSRTKSRKIGKIFYSVIFAKASQSQRTKLKNWEFARNRGQVQRLSR